jgi:hypothetical protein
MIDIQRRFRVDYALVGALGTVQLVFRVAGGIGAGTAATRRRSRVCSPRTSCR